MLHLTDATDSLPEPETPQDEPQPEIADEMQHHLSLNAMKGQSGMGIIRFTGMIGNIEVQVLVDGGSSDTYLQPRIAQFLKVPIEPIPKFQVLVGNGESLTVEGVTARRPATQMLKPRCSLPA
jgi:hypothetical protein